MIMLLDGRVGEILFGSGFAICVDGMRYAVYPDNRTE